MIEIPTDVEMHGADDVMVRRLNEADAEIVYAAVHYDTKHFIEAHEGSIPRMYATVEEARRRIAQGGARFHQIPCGIFAEHATLVGGVTVYPTDQGRRQAEVSYWVGAEHLGHHYAAIALNALALYLFSDAVHAASIVAIIHPENTGSIRTAERAGFTLANNYDGLLTYKRVRRAAT
jgi:RimJ/RimL family protein N-acetyltransferase